MRLSDFVPANFRGVGKFLMLGAWVDTCHSLIETGWSGVHVGSDARNSVRGGLESIKAELGIDPHFIKLLEGYHVRSVTMQEIINQFPGPYDLIWLNMEEKNRMLWYTRQVQDAIPKIYMMPEDGHNEDVVTMAVDRGYCSTVVEDWLALVHV